ncbi:MAG: flavin reductase family protein [Candidatus Solibacter usitatus]|nr:flavin reductase family protein [Candidatus Solibacter usitatus]
MSSEPSSSLSSAAFRRACSQFATGVAIATALDDAGVPHGLTVNSFTSVSLDPPLVLICLDYRVAMLPVFRTASHFAINVLSAEQRELADRFARNADQRFDGVSWTYGASTAPVLDEVLAAIECATWRIIEAGDHAIFIGEVAALTIGEGEPLLYFRSSYGLSG